MAKAYKRYEGDISIIIPKIISDGYTLCSMSDLLLAVKKKDILSHVITSTAYSYTTDSIVDLTSAQLTQALAGQLKVRLCILTGIDIRENSSMTLNEYSGTYSAIAYGSKDVA
jgi:uncharacterized protein YjgD (DUF1641 family)